MMRIARRTRTRAVRVAAVLAALAVVAWLVWRWSPATLLTVALAAPSVDAWHARWFGEATRDEVSIPAGPRTLRADLYRPPHARERPPAILLVHGLSAAGRRQPDLVRLAGLLARHGQLVLVPQLDGLAAFRLSGREVTDLRAAIVELQRLSGAVGVAGFSFGAGPALLAAADVPDLRWVGSFGGYAHLANVIAFIATGTHRFGDERHVGPVEEYNRWKLAALLVAFVDGETDREQLRAIVQEKLANPSTATDALEARLAPPARALLALVRSRREADVRAALDRLPAPARAALDALSPLGAVPRIRAPLLIAHGTADPSIPFTESLRLADVAGSRARLVILRTFHHTGPEAEGRGQPGLRASFIDACRLVGLADVLIRD
jgi:dienelactone hydrolase